MWALGELLDVAARRARQDGLRCRAELRELDSSLNQATDGTLHLESEFVVLRVLKS